MRVRIRNNQPNAAQRKVLREECVREFDTLLQNFNRDVMVQIIYLFHFKYGYGEKRLVRLVEDMKEALQGLHARYELSESDTPWICENRLNDAGVNVAALIDGEGGNEE